MGHTPVLIPDWTLLLQMAIFFACYFVLRFLVFKPYLALLRARKAKTVGLREQAAGDRQRAEQLQEQYDAFIKAERKKLSTWTEEERKRVNDEERKIVQDARDAVGNELQTLRTKIQSDYDRARKELLPLISEYSSQIVSKLTGKKVTVSASYSPSSENEHTVSH